MKAEFVIAACLEAVSVFIKDSGQAGVADGGAVFRGNDKNTNLRLLRLSFREEREILTVCTANDFYRREGKISPFGRNDKQVGS